MAKVSCLPVRLRPVRAGRVPEDVIVPPIGRGVMASFARIFHQELVAAGLAGPPQGAAANDACTGPTR